MTQILKYYLQVYRNIYQKEKKGSYMLNIKITLPITNTYGRFGVGREKEGERKTVVKSHLLTQYLDNFYFVC